MLTDHICACGHSYTEHRTNTRQRIKCECERYHRRKHILSEEQGAKANRKYRATHPDFYQWLLEDSKRRMRDIRKNLVISLGHRCACKEPDCWHIGQCVIEDYRILQIDHVDSGGTKEIELKGNRVMYLYYLKHPEEAKQKLQILCANCNWMKRHRNKEFPKSGARKVYNTITR